MPSRPPPWATPLSFLIMIFIWTTFALAQQQQAETPPPPPTNDGLLCSPFGACEPCPPEALNEPFCQPFGNRRLMHCINTTFTPSPVPPLHPPDRTREGAADNQLTALLPAGETPAWESCGRIVARERADFFEFIACNVVFALAALGVLVFRARRGQVVRARQLAARIGLIREGGRVVRP